MSTGLQKLKKIIADRLAEKKSDESQIDTKFFMDMITQLQLKVEDLEVKLAQTEAELKKKWRRDIKEELRVYHHNQYCDNGEEIEVQYSD